MLYVEGIASYWPSIDVHIFAVKQKPKSPLSTNGETFPFCGEQKFSQ